MFERKQGNTEFEFIDVLHILINLMISFLVINCSMMRCYTDI